MANKYAVLVGCNYPNTKNELHGCVNDVTHMRRTLIRRFGFPEHNITFMIDTDSASTKPTGKNILQALNSMVVKAKHGDVLFFHYSGHGTFIPAKKPHRRRGHTYDECIVPCDFNLLSDDDFRGIVNKVAKGASFTMMCDSCNSGGLIDKEKEQIGPHVLPITKKRRRPEARKFIPVESLMEVLKEKTGNPQLEIADIRVALFHLFGSDASSNVLSHAKYLLEKNGSHLTNGDSFPLLTNKAKKDAQLLLDGKSGALHDKKESVDGDMGILLSGCQSDETSADANPRGQAYGAFSNAVERVLGGHRKAISNKELVLRTRKLLGEAGYTQHPCLYCSDTNADESFLRQ
ncbi:hypothetical protein SUGI_0414150 [Cryptomeria japonica]|uniref:metacaspase-9 n=1 Tax=Cryptomeria japonica TaxID=3369 RepID=UPI002408CE91|nr:metacaspase-9 [Cryptomeria japonica]GLJ22091.1 hypothetical protein SUGI_0414150 [Cryptomeria japonica]